jgi:arginase family enzyme
VKALAHSLSRTGVTGIPYNTGSKGLSVEKGAEALRNAEIVDALRRFSEVFDFGDIREHKKKRS